MVKVWNVTDDEDAGKRNVSLVTSRDLGAVGALPLVHNSKIELQLFLGQGFLHDLVAG